MSDTTLVWVPKHLAKDIESVTSTEGLDAIVARYVVEQKKTVEADLGTLNEYVLMYKGLSATARLEFAAACTEAAEKSYEVFEEYDRQIPDIKEKVNHIIEMVVPVHKALDQLEQQLNNVDVSHLHSAIDLAERIAKMNDETRAALTAILGGE